MQHSHSTYFRHLTPHQICSLQGSYEEAMRQQHHKTAADHLPTSQHCPPAHALPQHCRGLRCCMLPARLLLLPHGCATLCSKDQARCCTAPAAAAVVQTLPTALATALLVLSSCGTSTAAALQLLPGAPPQAPAPAPLLRCAACCCAPAALRDEHNEDDEEDDEHKEDLHDEPAVGGDGVEVFEQVLLR